MAIRHRQEKEAHGFNWVFLAITGSLFLAIVIATYFIHRAQLQGVTDAMRDRAKAFAEEENYRKAADYTRRYLTLEPSDLVARIELAEYYDKIPVERRDPGRAIEYYFQALGPYIEEDKETAEASDEPGDDDNASEPEERVAKFVLKQDEESLKRGAPLAERLCELLFESRRYKELLEYCSATADEKTRERFRVMARLGSVELMTEAEVGVEPDMSGIEGDIRHALYLNPGDISLTVSLAHIIRSRPELRDDPDDADASDSENAEEAHDLLVDMIANAREGEEKAEAALAAVRFYVQYDEIDTAEQFVADALEWGGDRAAVAIAIGGFRMQQAGATSGPDKQFRLDQALEQFERAKELDDQSSSAYQGLADVAAEQGDFTTAVEQIELGSRLLERPNPFILARHAELLLKKADSESGSRDDELERVEQLLAQAEKAVSRLDAGSYWQNRQIIDFGATVLFLQGLLDLERGDPALAVSRLSTIRGDESISDETRIRVLTLLGYAYNVLKQSDLAASCLEEAAAIDKSNLALQTNAARASLKSGDPEFAVTTLREVAEESDTALDYYEYAVALFALQQSKSPTDRDIRSVTELLDEIETRIGDGSLLELWRPQLLRIDSIFASEVQRRLVESGMAANSRGSVQDLGDGVDSNLVSPEADEKIREILSAIVENYSLDTAALAGVARAYVKLGDSEGIESTLAKIRSIEGIDPGGVALFESDILMQQGKLDEARSVIRSALDKPEGSPLVTFELKSRLANLLISELPANELFDMIADLADEYPDKRPAIATSAFAIAYTIDRAITHERVLALIREVEQVGFRPMSTYNDGRALIDEMVKAKADGASQVRQANLEAEVNARQLDLQKHRPNWPPTSYLAGLIFDFNEDFDQAARNYEAAIDQGDRRTHVVLKAIRVLEQSGRMAQADRYVWMFADQLAVSEELSTLAVGLATRQNQLDRAERIAKQAIAARDADMSSLIDFGRVLFAKGDFDRAEEQFLQAKENDPKELLGWRWLFNFYSVTEDLKKAEEVLVEFESFFEQEQSAFDPFNASFFLARGYANLNNRPQATKYFDAAYAVHPRSPELLASMAVYFSTFDLELGEKYCRERMSLNSEDDSIPRLLAGILSNKRDESSWNEAIGILDRSGNEGLRNSVDQRLQSLLLLKRALVDVENEDKFLDRAEALVDERLSESVIKEPADLTLKATIALKRSESTRDINRRIELVDEAILFLDQVASRPEFNNETIQLLVRSLLTRHELALAMGDVERLPTGGTEGSIWLDDAADRIELLEIASDHSPLALRLRAEYLELAEGREAAIGHLVNITEAKIAELPEEDSLNQQLFIRLVSSRILRQFNAREEALRFAKEAYEIDAKYYDDFATSLAEVDRTEEAIDICLKHQGEDRFDRIKAIVTLCNVLSVSRQLDEVSERVGPVLEKALEEFPDEAILLSSVGSVYVTQGRTAEALKIYETAFEIAPSDLIVLNNRATLLSEDIESIPEALDLIDEAISRYGDLSALLDTKGMILRKMGSMTLAEKALLQATRKAEADARAYFHLAVVLREIAAQSQSSRTYRVRAVNALKRSMEKRLLDTVLTDEDKAILKDMQTDSEFADVFETQLQSTSLR